MSNITFSESIANLWHPTKNLPLTLHDVTPGSGRKVWWSGSCGHEWEAVIGNFVKKTNNFCPICSGQTVLKGFNDIRTTHAAVASQWHPTKNSKTPDEVTAGSGFKAIWLCDKNHEWEASVYHRTKPNMPGCPYCSGRLAIPGENDLSTINPELAKQWHPTRNKDLFPSMVKTMSNQKVWWIDEHGHEWETAVANRTTGKNCPYCSGNKVVPEKSVANFPMLLKRWSSSNIEAPETVLSTSCKSYLWVCDNNHKFTSPVNVQLKQESCPICDNKILLQGFNDIATQFPLLIPQWSSKNGIDPSFIKASSEERYWWICDKGHEVQRKVREVAKSKCPVCLNRIIIPGLNDLMFTHKEIAKEWHPTRNGELQAHQVGSGSGRKVWWQCEKGHEWETTVVSRTVYNLKCAVCSGRKIISGFNDLQTLHPELLNKWSSRNTTDPLFVSPGSEQLTWWICDKGHESLMQTKSRVNSPDACQKCWQEKVNSYAETAIKELLEDKGIEVISSDRKILNGKELDLYMPQEQFAIEYNGVYWHSEATGKTKNYHYDKWKVCKDKGIQLIQIWEDDWNRDSELVKNAILHKLNLKEETKIYARKTTIVTLTKEDTRNFLNKNHIQGFVTGSINVGLMDENNNIVAVMVLKQEPHPTLKALNLLRYATSVPVVGGFTKLLSHIEKTSNIDLIMTFSDNTISDGGLYENNGFIKQAELPPDYMYVVKGERKHKFGYRLKRFRNDPNLKFEEGLTEKQLAELNNIPRIWDAGKTKWVKKPRTNPIT